MSDETLTGQFSFRVADSLHQIVELIRKKERRKQNEAARALLERGVFAYVQDEKLFDEDSPDMRELLRELKSRIDEKKPAIKKRA